MNCQKCGAENKDNASFCNNCGVPLVPIPAKSTTPLESGGTPVPPEKKLGPLFWWAVVFLILFSILVTIIFWNVPPPMNAICDDTYPGTYYSRSSGMCEHTRIPTPTVSRISAPTSQSSSCIELMDFLTKEEVYRKGSIGYLHLHGMITNNCNRELKAVRVCAILYDANDMVVGTSGTTVFSIRDDTTGAFDLYFHYSEGMKQVSRYQIDTRDLELSSNYKC